jgi:hypothetical protein
VAFTAEWASAMGWLADTGWVVAAAGVLGPPDAGTTAPLVFTTHMVLPPDEGAGETGRGGCAGASRLSIAPRQTGSGTPASAGATGTPREAAGAAFPGRAGAAHGAAGDGIGRGGNRVVDGSVGCGDWASSGTGRPSTAAAARRRARRRARCSSLSTAPVLC